MPSFLSDANYMRIIPLVLNSEGGFVDDPADPGGPTMRGIAWNYNADWLRQRGYMRTTIHLLTKEEALLCYYERYWLASDSDKLDDLRLAYIHFDSAVNNGTGQAKLFLGRLSKKPSNYSFKDGHNRALAAALFDEYVAQRMRFYTHAKTRKKHLEGWINRLADVVTNSAALYDS